MTNLQRLGVLSVSLLALVAGGASTWGLWYGWRLWTSGQLQVQHSVQALQALKVAAMLAACALAVISHMSLRVPRILTLICALLAVPLMLVAGALMIELGSRGPVLWP